MRPHVASLLLVVALAGVACAPSGAGPTGPVPVAQITPDDAVKAAGARAAAEAFVRAYADDTTRRVDSLAALAGTPLVRSWVHWLSVQNREFPGTISGTISNDQIGPAAPFAVSSVPGSDSILRQVDIRATVTFSLRPRTGGALRSIRSLDGPMRLILAPDGAWKVLDFTRDGIPLSQEFEVVKAASIVRDGVRITIASFLSAPYWEFGLQIASHERVRLQGATTDLIDANGHVVSRARAVTASLTGRATGSPVEGIVTFPPQTSATGLSLRIAAAGPAGIVTFTFPLGTLIHPLPLSSSPSPSPSG